MAAKLDAAKQLTGCTAELVFVPSAEEGLALVAVDIHRFGLLLVGECLCYFAGIADYLSSGLVCLCRWTSI
jgi:hypothetical protein